MAHITQSLEDWTAAAEYFDGPHGRIAYWQAGEGRPLLLVHGFPTASWDWARIWDDLIAAGYRVIALDMLGFGLSDKPASHTYSLIDQAELHIMLLDRLGIDACDVIAHDYGVSVVQEMVARQGDGALPVKLSKVVWLNGGLIPGQHRPRLIQRLLEGPLGPLISRLMSQSRFNSSFSAVFGPDTQPDDQELADFWTLMEHNGGHRISHLLIRYMQDRRDNYDRWVGVLGKGIVTERMINGGLDPVSGSHLADAYAGMVQDADLVRLDDVGHYPQWEAPEPVLKACLDFLKD